MSESIPKSSSQLISESFIQSFPHSFSGSSSSLSSLSNSQQFSTQNEHSDKTTSIQTQTINDNPEKTSILISSNMNPTNQNSETNIYLSTSDITDNFVLLELEEIQTDGNWTLQSNHKLITSTPGSQASFTFRGSDIMIYATVGPRNGCIYIYLDGNYLDKASSYSNVRKEGVRIYSSISQSNSLIFTEGIPFGEHEIILEFVGTENEIFELEMIYYVPESLNEAPDNNKENEFPLLLVGIVVGVFVIIVVIIIVIIVVKRRKKGSSNGKENHSSNDGDNSTTTNNRIEFNVESINYFDDDIDFNTSELKTNEFQLYDDDDIHHNSDGIRFDFEEQGDHPFL